MIGRDFLIRQSVEYEKTRKGYVWWQQILILKKYPQVKAAWQKHQNNEQQFLWNE